MSGKRYKKKRADQKKANSKPTKTSSGRVIEKDTQQQQQPELLLWFSQFWKLIVAFSVVLGIIVSFLAISPSITVSTSQSLDPADPLATSFLITNTGLLPIHSIIFLCQLNKVVTTQPVTYIHFKLGYATPPLPILYPQEQKTFWAPKIINFPYPIVSADINILVSYRPDFLFWHKSKSYRFVTVPNKESILFWYGKPEAEP
jgi:hypothetical protein